MFSAACVYLVHTAPYDIIWRDLLRQPKWTSRHTGQRAFDSMQDDCQDPEFFIFNFDNINQYVIPRTETIGNKSMMKNGTAATAIVMEDVPKGAFKREPYIRNIQEGRRRNLTVEALYKEIDGEHRAKIGTATIMRILVKHIGGLHSLRKLVEQLYKDPTICALRRLWLRKTRVLSYGTSGINEALVEGASDVLDDLCEQSGMDPEWFEILLILVGSDQLTVDRIRKAINHLDQEESIYHSKSWAVPLIQPWHMGWAYLKSIFRIHWFEATGKSTLGFRRSSGVLGRNPNPEDYYSAEDAVVTVFETMVLSAARYVLLLLSILERYFNPDGPLCDMQYFSSLARRIYDEYMTTDAYHSALSDPTSTEPSAADIKHILKLEMQKIRQNLDKSEGFLAGSRHTGSTEDAPTLLTGDQALANGKLFMRDTLEFIEFTSAMEEGDTGRLFKVMDTILFSFWGSKSTNYGSELLEMVCKMLYEYPAPLKEAILNNYLVNPLGLPGKWQAGDFLQEHFNKDIKRIFDHKSAGFDDKFMRESISLNIPGFSQAKDQLLEILHLARTGKRRTDAKKHQDINVLGAHFEDEHLFDFTPGRTQPYQAVDMVATGKTRMEEGALKSFLDRTLNDPGAVADPSADDETQVAATQTHD
ncbi:hypothetical protein RSOL_047140 [Rhizoctonia solani AG-3 Rhs1AP]|uniref:DUF6589 domain-containing protein n=1 Tax=Rhizoctonia solani AG-3 Rhs1AP TaxID=1086054 RepID=X8IW93_9AGAM|nr:hypothetical protein RSOL_047140 [Rhizoctonia solani AG-3 Rhs1AP]